MSGDNYYSRLLKCIKKIPLIEARCATVAGQKHSSNVCSRQYNKLIQRNTILTTLNNKFLEGSAPKPGQELLAPLH